MTTGDDGHPVGHDLTAASLAAAGHLKWTAHGPRTLGASVAEMDYGTAPAVTAALHAAVDASRLGYLPPDVARDLAEACARFQATAHGWDVDPAWVRPVADVLTGLELVLRHRCGRDAAVIVPTPAYMPFLSLPLQLDRRTIQVATVPVDGRPVLDLDALDRAFADGGRVLVLCNPHNPLGTVLTTDELDAVAGVVARHDGLVFADEIHAPVVFPGHVHVPYASRSATAAAHTVTATSASKAWNLAGLACAQLILTRPADRELVDGLYPTPVGRASTLGAIAATAAYRDGGPWLDGVRATLDGNRRLLADLLAEHLPAVRSTTPEGTYLAWLDCRALGLPVAPAAFFEREADVALVDGARCGPSGAGFVRLNFATTADLLTRMVHQMAAAVGRAARAS